MSTNGVRLEVHDANRIRRKLKLLPHTLRRNPAGDWTFTFDLQFDLRLDDGRIVRGERRVAIGRLVQIGRKPRKSPAKKTQSPGE